MFDLKWGFFAVMGGFQMTVSDESGERPHTLSPKGVTKLAAVNLIPFMIPRSFIEDRSKAIRYKRVSSSSRSDGWHYNASRENSTVYP